MGPKIWTLVPSIIRNTETLEIFKKRIVYWKQDHYNPYEGFVKTSIF